MLRPDRASLSDLLCLHSKCQKVTPILCELLTNGKKQKQKNKQQKRKLHTFDILWSKSYRQDLESFPSAVANYYFTSHLGITT